MNEMLSLDWFYSILNGKAVKLMKIKIDLEF